MCSFPYSIIDALPLSYGINLDAGTVSPDDLNLDDCCGPKQGRIEFDRRLRRGLLLFVCAVTLRSGPRRIFALYRVVGSSSPPRTRVGKVRLHPFSRNILIRFIL